MGYPEKRAPEGGLRQPSQKTWVSVAKNTTDAENTPDRWLLLLLLLLRLRLRLRLRLLLLLLLLRLLLRLRLRLRLRLLLLLLLLLPHRSRNRRKKHDFLRPSGWGGGLRQPSQKTWVTVAKNTTDAKNTPYQCKKHDQPSQKTCPPTRTVAKNTRHRCKKHLPREPSQKTQELATVAKNMSYRRKKHATRNRMPIRLRLIWKAFIRFFSLASKKARNEATACVFSFKGKGWKITLGKCQAPRKPSGSRVVFFLVFLGRNNKKSDSNEKTSDLRLRPHKKFQNSVTILQHRPRPRGVNFHRHGRKLLELPPVVVDFDRSLNATKLAKFHCEVCMCWLRHWIHEN